MASVHLRAPWKDVTFAGAYWNCGPRLEKLLKFVRPWFKTIIAVVQESPDNTLEVARKYADVVIEEPWMGRGDPSIHTAVEKVKTKWVFVISDDEMPTTELLHSFQDLVDELKAKGREGAWLHFASTIDGIDFTREQDQHLRFFAPHVGWPSTQHARPMTDNTIQWRPAGGQIHHDRSLDEMITDYLRRYELGRRDATPDQQAHNQRMMRSAVEAVSRTKGEEYVTGFEWYPEVVRVAYGGNDPFPQPEPVVEPEAAPAAPPKRGRPRKAA
jgi:hypothetical protein